MVLCQFSQPANRCNALIRTGQTSDLKVLLYSYALAVALVLVYVTVPILL